MSIRAMASILPLVLVLGVPMAGAQSAVTADTFKSYILQYQSPEFFQDNGQAWLARLKLLDQAPRGAKVKIATFLLENGEVARQLTRHLCLASARGVQVDLLVDSKSGDRLGVNDPFDLTPDSQVIEQIYVYLANCGTRVHIHNSFDDFIEYSGQRYPNIFNLQMHDSQKGRTVSLLNFGNRVEEIVGNLAGLSAVALAEQGAYGVDTQTFSFNFMHLIIDLIGLKNDAGASAAAAKISTEYQNFVMDPAWRKMSPAQLLSAIPSIKSRFKAYPDVRDVYAQARRFNRLNHKKLFLVEWPGGEGCMFIGGRNLGDNYLKFDNQKGSVFDGDLLYCRQHSADPVLQQAEASFDSLLTDHSDPFLDASVLGAGPLSAAYNSIRLVKKDPSAKLPDTRDIGALPPMVWPDDSAVHGDVAIANGSHWRILVANWSEDPRRDQVQQALLSMIQNEQQEVFIETAYAEFDKPLRAALEAALARGVHVKIITNSFAETDGNSRLIRILMAPWENKIKTLYHDKIEILLSSSVGGHMTHFKGAGFRCQKSPMLHKSFIVGSHNFHPRSGRADKEHAIAWEEPADPGCAAGAAATGEDLISQREAFYQKMSAVQAGHLALTPFQSLYEELVGMIARRSHDPAGAFLASVLKQAVYQNGNSGHLLYEPNLDHVLDVMGRGGLSDVLGTML